MKLFSLTAEKSAHGGSLRAGRRKVKRPFVPRRPMHIVLRSSRARGALSLLRHERVVLTVVRGQAKKHFVKMQRYVNVGNHLHIQVRANSRETFQAFLISTSAMIARKVTGARRGQARGKFWDGLAFTRVLRTSHEERVLRNYFFANALEVKHGHEVREIFLGRAPLHPS